MNRSDFQKLSDIRISEAKCLLDNQHYEGAYYLAGYAVECALKACIAKKTKEHDFPPKKEFVNEVYSHRLQTLLKLTELPLEQERQEIRKAWNVIKDWNEERRYDPGILEKDSRDLYSAVADPADGVLTWLKKYW